MVMATVATEEDSTEIALDSEMGNPDGGGGGSC